MCNSMYARLEYGITRGNFLLQVKAFFFLEHRLFLQKHYLALTDLPTSTHFA